MTWSNSSANIFPAAVEKTSSPLVRLCPSCGHRVQFEHHGGENAGIQDFLPGLPVGVKFDPSDQELLEHLERKTRPELQKHHPNIDGFIPTLEGENGICYTHPENCLVKFESYLLMKQGGHTLHFLQ